MNLTNQPFDQAEAEEMNKIKEKQRATAQSERKASLHTDFSAKIGCSTASKN
jgi:hypothetical protein